MTYDVVTLGSFSTEHIDQTSTSTDIEGNFSSTSFSDTTRCEGLLCYLTVLLSSIISTAIITALLVIFVVLVAVCCKNHTKKVVSERGNEPVYEEVSERKGGEETAGINMSAYFKVGDTYEFDENEAYYIT